MEPLMRLPPARGGELRGPGNNFFAAPAGGEQRGVPLPLRDLPQPGTDLIGSKVPILPFLPSEE